MLRQIMASAVLLAVASTSALAQLQHTFDAGAGIVGGEGTGAGAVGHVAFELRSTRLPVSLRVDASHHQWRDGFLTGRSLYRASAATTNLVYRFPAARLRPYVLGGAGAYALHGEGARFGWNVGAGVETRLGRYRVFGELRSHFVDSAVRQRLTPLVVGLRF